MGFRIRSRRAVSICIHCGRDHIASLRICPQTGKPLGHAAQVSQKTLFGVAPAPLPPLHPSAPSRNLTPLAVSLPPPKPLGAPSPALAKTMLGALPPPPPPPAPPTAMAATVMAVAPVAVTAQPAPRLAPSSTPPQARLPTEQEVRDNPDLVISLDVTPPAGLPLKATPSPRPGPATKPVAPPAFAAETRTSPGPATRGAGAAPAGKLSAPSSPETPGSTPSGATPVVPPVELPVDLPPVAASRRFVLPHPEDETTRLTPRESNRLVRDAQMVLGLVAWAFGNYLRNLKAFLAISALSMLPVAVVASCLLAASLPPPEPTLLGKLTSTTDFSERKAELAARIQRAATRGQADAKASAELAALTSVETALSPLQRAGMQEEESWFRPRLAAFIQGLLLFGVALPLALALLGLLTIDQEGGIALPGVADVWGILVSRGELFLVTLLPAALLVALGYALFVVPGLVVSALLVFLPHVVLFEKRRGRAAFERSFELIRTDARRAVPAFVLLALVGFVAATLAGLLFPRSGSRAAVFAYFLFADALAAALLPIPAMVLARLYLDIRARTGSIAQRLSRTVRS